MGGGCSALTGTWIQATDSDGFRFTVQTQANGVVPGVAQSLPLLGPITTRHRALRMQHKPTQFIQITW